VADKWRNVQFYKVNAVKRVPNPLAGKDNPEEPITKAIEADLEGLFRRISECRFDRSDSSNIIEIDGAELALTFMEYYGDAIYLQFRKVVTGPVVRASTTGESSGDVEISIPSDQIGYESAVVVYLPTIKVLALEGTVNLPHNKGLQDYINTFISKQSPLDMGVDEVRLSEDSGVFAKEENIHGIVRNVRLKFKAGQAGRAESEGYLGDLLRMYGSFEHEDAICEVLIRRERVKGGERPVFNNAELKDFWETDGSLLESIDLNYDTQEWIPLGREVSFRRFKAAKDGRLIKGDELAQKIAGFMK